MATARFRLQIKFWLDLHKTEERDLADLIAELKQARTFSRVVRDGIRLVTDLWRGNLDVLLALFPWVEEAFYQRFVEQQPGLDSAIQAHLTRLEQLLLEQGNNPVTVTGSGLKPSVGVAQSMHIQEEMDSLLVVKKSQAGGNSAQNFLDAAFGLVQ